MIVRTKSACFIFLPQTVNELGETESAEWLNLANVSRAYEVIGDRIFVQFIGGENTLYHGIQAEIIKQELDKICPEQIN